MAEHRKYRITRGCTQCGTCIFECRVGAIQETDHGFIIEDAKCVGCGRCYQNCASEAIERVPQPAGDSQNGVRP